MFAKISVAAGLLALAATFAPVSAATMPQSRIGNVAADVGALLQKAQWGHRHCRYWHDECAARWGWRTRMYYRCLARHGC